MSIPVRSDAASGIAIAQFDDGARTLLVKRCTEDGGFWCHVAGGIEAGELAWQTIVREFKEEAGLKLTNLYVSEYIEQFYQVAKNQIMIVPLFVTYVESNTSIILNSEHTDYKWCLLKEAKTLAPFIGQHAVYDFIWEHFIEKRPHHMLQIDISAE